jgi:tRNA(Ile)-lysidine synthase
MLQKLRVPLLIEMILEKVKKTIKKYNLIRKGDKIVVAVSGGPDSVTLLYLLNSLKKELEVSLQIAHLDHMLRKGSYKDREFVEGLSRKLKIPITCSQVNVKELAKKGSVEEIARNARLRFLFKVAKDTKSKKIAIGHNLDDQAETVLMRILRGTGLYGLSGILPKRNIAGFDIIRPLIETRREDIETFLKGRKIKPRLDSSNLENIYFRNKIRNNLLPLLEKEYNCNIKDALSNIAQTVGDDYDYLSKAAQGFLRKSAARIHLKKFLRLHPAIQRLVLRQAIASVKGNTRRITLQHIKEIEDLVLNRPFNSIVDLPQGVSVKKKQKYLIFYLR